MDALPASGAVGDVVTSSAGVPVVALLALAFVAVIAVGATLVLIHDLIAHLIERRAARRRAPRRGRRATRRVVAPLEAWRRDPRRHDPLRGGARRGRRRDASGARPVVQPIRERPRRRGEPRVVAVRRS